MSNNRWSHRSPVTGRFQKIDVSNTPLADDSEFPTFSKEGFEVGFPSDVQDSPYELVPGDRNVVSRPVAPRVEDDFGVNGWPVQARKAELVPGDDHAETIYGFHGQGQIGRIAAARDPRDCIPGTNIPMDASRRTTGAE